MLSVLVVCVKATMVIIGLLILSMTAVFIHSNVYPAAYDKVVQNQQGDFYYDVKVLKAPDSYDELKKTNNNSIYYNRLAFVSKLAVFIRYIILYGSALFIFKQILNILLGARKYSSFFVSNSRSLKRISGVIIFYSVYNLLGDFLGRSYEMTFNDGYFTKEYHLYNPHSYLFLFVFLILSYSLSLVFAEGERLKVENELTV